MHSRENSPCQSIFMLDSKLAGQKEKHKKQGRVLRGHYNRVTTCIYFGSLGEDIPNPHYLQY